VRCRQSSIAQRRLGHRPAHAIAARCPSVVAAKKRQPDPDDLRSKRVALTPRGTSAVHVIRDAVEEIETAWARRLGPERFTQLRGLLVNLNESA
jgi:hypothetical protein